MRILFVSERFPYPLDNGGNVRTYHLLRGLAGEHQITLASEEPDAGVDQTAVRKLCASVHTVPQNRRSLAKELLRLFRSLLCNSAFLLDRHRNRSLQLRVRDLTQHGDFDAIHLNHLDAALNIPHVGGQRHLVLDEHNIVSNQAITTLREKSRRILRILLRWEVSKLQRVEGELASATSRVLVCSEADRAHLCKLSASARAIVIPNGVDLEYFKPLAPTSAFRNTLLFVGSMDYEPCDRAMRYFCAEILPLIRGKRPDAKLVVVGRNPSASLRAIASRDPLIELAGRVPDIRQIARSATVFVVPLLSGSGTRLKILEAMAMGLPIVTTTIGLEGIEATHGHHCLVADDAVSFSEAAITLLDSPPLADQLAVSARSLVETQYGWDAINGRLLAVYQTLDSP